MQFFMVVGQFELMSILTSHNGLGLSLQQTTIGSWTGLNYSLYASIDKMDDWTDQHDHSVVISWMCESREDVEACMEFAFHLVPD